jgi:hypothetical protein
VIENIISSGLSKEKKVISQAVSPQVDTLEKLLWSHERLQVHIHVQREPNAQDKFEIFVFELFHKLLFC